MATSTVTKSALLSGQGGCDMSYKIQVIADDTGKYYDNGIRLASEAEAQRYGADLAARWYAVREMRVVPSQDPVNYTFADGRLTWVTGAGYIAGAEVES